MSHWKYGSIFLFKNLVQDKQIRTIKLVQDYIFTSCTRSNIINSTNQTEQHNHNERKVHNMRIHLNNATVRVSGFENKET